MQSLSVSCFHIIFGLPGPCFPSTCRSKAVLTAPLECSICPYQWSLLSFRMRSVIRVLCQVLEPTALLVHPVLAAIAEDADADHSSGTDGTWKLAWTLQEVQACTTDHDLHLSCIYSQSFLLLCFFPSQEPPDTFLKRFSDDNKVIHIEVLPSIPEWNSRDKASSTMMKSSGLSTKPWWCRAVS